jgi:hypothetical protein
MNYEQATDETAKAENSENVTFTAFFTRDLDGDGNAEKLLGTCKDINDKDVLYMDLNILTEGYLKNGLITIQSNNREEVTAWSPLLSLFYHQMLFGIFYNLLFPVLAVTWL